jgi:DNA-binding transcriptional MocR family regulator
MLDDLKLPESDRPVYQRLADAISDRILRGELVEGDKLPTHREIARALGINVTTVTRAISTLQQQGLVAARPGRGTLVATREAEVGGFKSAPSQEAGVIDLTVNRPATTAYTEALATLLPRLSEDDCFASLQDYHPPVGPHWARAAIAGWLSGVAGGGDPDRMVLTNGAQHGIACVLRAVAQRGDVILTESIAYQGISALCRSEGLALRGVAFDRGGMLPEAFQWACANLRPRAVFLVPSLHNPTTVTLSETRRHALVKIARQHNVLIVEDDVYRPLLDSAPPTFATLEPELTIYVSALSKTVAPGLRCGFVVAPRAVLAQVAAALRIDCWSISPLDALIVTKLFESGSAARIIQFQREELRRRQTTLREMLAAFDVQTDVTSTHAWLHLPEPWRSGAFTRACRQRGVAVLPAEAFAVGRETLAHAVRINLGAAPSIHELRRALTVMVELLTSSHLEISGAF